MTTHQRLFAISRQFDSAKAEVTWQKLIGKSEFDNSRIIF